MHSSTGRLVRLLVLVLATVLIGAACASEPTVATDTASSASGSRIPTPDPAGPSIATAVPEATLTPLPVVADAPEPTKPEDVVAARKVVRVVAEFPHMEDSFTQGLLIDETGSLWESTGRYGASTTRLIEVDRATGEPIRQAEVTGDEWGEGLALIGDRFVQLTYTSKVAFVWDRENLEKIGEFRYDTAGWGLCHDDTRGHLVMSDGSADLVFRDPDTFAPLGRVTVLLDGAPLTAINELECVDGHVWANVFLTDMIIEIDPLTGAVLTVVDGSALQQPRPFDANAVLNGIAYDPVSGNFLVTGKFWDTVYEVEFVSG